MGKEGSGERAYNERGSRGGYGLGKELREGFRRERWGNKGKEEEERKEGEDGETKERMGRKGDELKEWGTRIRAGKRKGEIRQMGREGRRAW